jgi:hypothetical protein
MPDIVDRVDRLVSFLNQIFPGSQWEGNISRMSLSDYDVNLFRQIVEEKIPPKLWVIFVHSDSIYVCNQHYSQLDNWIKQGAMVTQSVPFRYHQLNIIIRRISYYSSLSIFDNTREIHNGLLTIQLPDDEANQIFVSSRMYTLIDDDHIAFRLEDIDMIADYLDQIFPMIRPTSCLIQCKMRSYLQRLITTLDLKSIRVDNRIYGSDIELDILSKHLPIPMKLKPFKSEYRIMNFKDIYHRLWNDVVHNAQRRDLILSILHPFIIPDLTFLIGEYLIPFDDYLHLHHRHQLYTNLFISS